MRTTIIFLFLLFSSKTQITDKRVKCFMEKFYELIDMSADVRLIADSYLKTKDFSQKQTFDSISRIEFFDEVDFKLPAKIAKLLLNTQQMSDQLRRIVENCFPVGIDLKRICEQVYPNEGCEVFDGFVAAKNCEAGYFGVDWVYCVPHCPSNYDEDPYDPFVCKKSELSELAENLAFRYDLKPSFWKQTDYMFYACPEGFIKIGLNICIRVCPFEWIDYGDSCAKPLIKRRDFELFFYTLEMDVEVGGKSDQQA